jgi:hypothetical protein
MLEIQNILIKTILWLLAIVFIVFYPMFISIYVFLPLMVGVMGYIFIQGIERNKLDYIIVAGIYLINLDLNLSLPIFLSIVASMIVYVMIDKSFLAKTKCKLCKALISVVLIDFVYLGVLLGYDFVFQTQSIVLDELLVYSLIVDMIVAVIL